MKSKKDIVEDEQELRKELYAKRFERENAFVNAQRKMLTTLTGVEQMEKLALKLQKRIEQNKAEVVEPKKESVKDTTQLSHKGQLSLDQWMSALENRELKSCDKSLMDIPFLHTLLDASLLVDNMCGVVHSCAIWSGETDKVEYAHFRQILVHKIIQCLRNNVFRVTDTEGHHDVSKYCEDVLPRVLYLVAVVMSEPRFRALSKEREEEKKGDGIVDSVKGALLAIDSKDPHLHFVCYNQLYTLLAKDENCKGFWEEFFLKPLLDCTHTLSNSLGACLKKLVESLSGQLNDTTNSKRDWLALMDDLKECLHFVQHMAECQTLLQCRVLAGQIEQTVVPTLMKSVKESMEWFLANTPGTKGVEKSLDVSICCETLQGLVLNKDIKKKLNDLKMIGLKKWCDEMSQQILGKLGVEIEMLLSSKSLFKHWEHDVPKYVSPYIDKVCLQFVQTILWVATVPQLPDWKDTLFALEMEFRNACSTEINRQIRSLLSQSSLSLSESFVIQLWFDLSFAKQIIAANTIDWDYTLKLISNHMDLVIFKSLEAQLETEVRHVVRRCSLLYGTSHIFSGLLFENTSNTDNKPSSLWRPKTMPRVQTLPIATYDVTVVKREHSNELRSLGELENDSRRNLVRLSNINSPAPTHFISDALTRANSLFQNLNLGTMFK
ncbi:hypothetical protein RFI_11345 [Reticulomyxa filosa]|uniref:Uncharacterized protein n=1 Tax=Reticulomyxa filosa TaxID=46433 RepID=X6NII3_RETFI|nr:hypothetical protein RFI_11345 [Reticulomyxa filosa]|eukprot:ETO25791.1 hypothetical protein RFI_11345 [Reticulomyxa filosa]